MKRGQFCPGCDQPFDGVHLAKALRPVGVISETWRSGFVRPAGGPSIEEAMKRAWERILQQRGGPDIEIHSPDCPKIVSKGEKACRCGGAPLEAIFEDMGEVREP